MNEGSPSPSSPVRRRHRWVAWLVLAVAVVAAGWWVLGSSPTPSPALPQGGSFTPLSASGGAGGQIGQLIESFNPTLGAASAPLVVVEYVDFSCPYSEQAYAPLREFAARHPGEVRLVLRHFPIDDLHPRARPAALAAVCAHRQGKFWQYYDKLFANQSQHEDADLTRYAVQVGLDLNSWRSCRTSTEVAAQVQQDLEDGVARGVPGTPTFFINGYRLSGALPLEAWEQILDRFGS